MGCFGLSQAILLYIYIVSWAKNFWIFVPAKPQNANQIIITWRFFTVDATTWRIHGHHFVLKLAVLMVWRQVVRRFTCSPWFLLGLGDLKVVNGNTQHFRMTMYIRTSATSSRIKAVNKYWMWEYAITANYMRFNMKIMRIKFKPSVLVFSF